MEPGPPTKLLLNYFDAYILLLCIIRPIIKSYCSLLILNLIIF